MAYIEPRKNKNGIITSYRIIVSGGIAPDGKQNKYTMTFKPSPDMTEKQTQKQLNEIAVDFERQCKNGLMTNNPNITLNEYISIYLKTAENTLAASTYEFYHNTINSVILPALGDLKLLKIKPAHVQEFINRLCELPSKNDPNKKISPNTVDRYLDILQSIFTLAVKQELIKESPASACKLSLPKKTKKNVEIFTKQEAAEMLLCLDSEPLQFQTLIQLAIASGARRGELVALKFSDVDFERCRISIERAAVHVKGQQIIKSTKSGKARRVTVYPECIELIKRLQAEKSQLKKSLGTAWRGDDFIFTQNDGAMMCVATPTKQFSSFLKRHDLKHRKFHALRHTSATLMLYGGRNIKEVQERLGHGDIATTEKYLHCIDDLENDAANTLRELLIKPSAMMSSTDVKQQA